MSAPRPAPFVLVSGDFVLTGGQDRAVYALASYLARAGHPVELVAHRVEAALAQHPGVSVERAARPFGAHFAGEWFLERASRRATRRARGAKVVVSGAASRVRADACWVHYVHAAYAPRVRSDPWRRAKHALARPIWLRAERRILPAAGQLIANSLTTARSLVEHLGVAEDRISTVYYGVDPDRFRPQDPAQRAERRAQLGWDERPRVLFVGALGDDRKGFATLYEAWRALGSDWDAALAVVGAGSDRPRWQDRVEADGLAHSVEWLGFRTDVAHLLGAADLLVAPARYEAYGLAVHEALCCGLPALVSASAGVAERYPTELSSWLLPDPRDARDLAARLVAWRASPAAWRDQTAPLSATLRRRGWDDMARDIAQLLAG